jgi:hypothetical protein
MSEYDVEFNVPSQTLESGIVKYTTVNSRGRIEHKTREVVAGGEDNIFSAFFTTMSDGKKSSR